MYISGTHKTGDRQTSDTHTHTHTHRGVYRVALRLKITLFRREKRVTIIMGTITLAFLVCWWPYAVIFMMGDTNPAILQKVVTLAYLNSLINPILYICINKQVRKAIMKMFTCQEQEHDR